MDRMPIDFVLTWVDDQDPEWQKEKNAYMKLCGAGTDETLDASDERYRDWNNLKYWFRCVEKNAPWVNKIFFVTCGQKPEWLNADHPKLVLIDHKDYIPEEYLPTFSSHPIELNFHRIHELSEQFVYFNDDLFLTAPVEEKDFFRDGLPCDSLVEEPLGFSNRTHYNHIRINDIIFANQHFSRKNVRKELKGKLYSWNNPHDSIKNIIMGTIKCPYFFGLAIHHLPQAYLKKTLEEVWKADGDLLRETCGHRFRNTKDVSQYVFKYWQLMNGNFTPYNKRKYGKLFEMGRQTEEICDAIQSKKYKMVCFNDSQSIEYEKDKKRLIEAFEAVYPEKSSFER